MGPTKEELSKQCIFSRYYCDLCRLLLKASYVQGSGCQFWSMGLSFNKGYLFFWSVCLFLLLPGLKFGAGVLFLSEPCLGWAQHQEGKGLSSINKIWNL